MVQSGAGSFTVGLVGLMRWVDLTGGRRLLASSSFQAWLPSSRRLNNNVIVHTRSQNPCLCARLENCHNGQSGQDCFVEDIQSTPDESRNHFKQGDENHSTVHNGFLCTLRDMRCSEHQSGDEYGAWTSSPTLHLLQHFAVLPSRNNKEQKIFFGLLWLDTC